MYKTEAFLVDLAVLVDKHGASLFFGDRPAHLWIDGDFAGEITDSEGADGARFEEVGARWVQDASEGAAK